MHRICQDAKSATANGRGLTGRTVGRIDRLEDAEGPSGADNSAGTKAAGQLASDASRYMAATMAGAAGVAPAGHQDASQGHAHPPPRAHPHSQPASDAAEAQRMAARLQHHLAYGAVGLATRSIGPTP